MTEIKPTSKNKSKIKRIYTSNRELKINSKNNNPNSIEKYK